MTSWPTATHLQNLSCILFTYVGVTNKLALLKFCHLRWYRYLVWPMDYTRRGAFGGEYIVTSCYLMLQQFNGLVL